MELEYTLARITAGHDKGIWCVIVREDGGFAYIADGRRRKLESPKKKNPKHLEITKKQLKLDYYTDKSLRKALWVYNYGEGYSEDNPEVSDK